MLHPPETQLPLSPEPDLAGGVAALIRAWGLGEDPIWGEAARRALDEAAQTPEDRLGACARLEEGAALTRRWDAAWARPVAPDPGLDVACGAAWACLLSGAPFGALAYVKAHLVGEAERVFRSVMVAVNLPEHERARVRRGLREGYFFALIDPAGGVPAVLDLAFRVLEAGPAGPVAALSERMPPSSWPAAARCLARRRSWIPTSRALWAGERGPPQRARRIRRLLERGPGRFPALFLLHQWTRLCRDEAAPGEGDGSEEPRALGLRRRRAQVRARLRALLAQTPGVALPLLLATPALHGRTQAAARRLAWAWAQRELETGFSLGLSACRLPACALPAARPCPPDLEGALDTWVLLVALRGHLDGLIRWLERGTAANGGGSWGRLLSEGLPTPLRGARGERRAQLREWIGPDPLARLARHRALLRGLTALPVDRGLRARARALLAPIWHPQIPLPDRDFPALCRHAALVLGRLPPAPEEAP